MRKSFEGFKSEIKFIAEALLSPLPFALRIHSKSWLTGSLQRQSDFTLHPHLFRSLLSSAWDPHSTHVLPPNTLCYTPAPVISLLVPLVLLLATSSSPLTSSHHKTISYSLSRSHPKVHICPAGSWLCPGAFQTMQPCSVSLSVLPLNFLRVETRQGNWSSPGRVCQPFNYSKSILSIFLAER